MQIKFKQGRHHSNQRYGLTHSNIVAFRFMFDDNSKYTLPAEDQYDWNKLYGMASITARLINPAHFQSLRLGWRYLNNQFQITYYGYSNGMRIYGKAVTVPANEIIEATIVKGRYHYTLTVMAGNKLILVKVFEVMHRNSAIQLLLPAYFGGNNPAPKQISYWFVK